MTGFIQKIIAAVEDIAIFIASIFGTNVSKFNTLEAKDTDEVLLTRDGCFMSGIRLNGYSSTVGAEEFERIVTIAGESLKSQMTTPGCVLQFWFARDPDNTERDLNATLRAARATAKQLGLEMDEFLDFKIRHLKKYCATEEIYLGIWTTPARLDKAMASAMAQERKESRPPVQFPIRGQDVSAGMRRLRDIHLGVVKQILSDIDGSGVRVELLNAHEVVRVARQSISPGRQSANWKPRLAGDVIPATEKGAGRRNGKVNLEDLYLPPIYEQIFTDDFYRIDSRLINSNGITFAPVFIKVPAAEPQNFSKLFARLDETKIPWRASFVIESGGLATLAAKGESAGILQWASSHNKSIFKSYSELKERALEEPILKVRMSFCTWAPEDDAALLRTRVSQLISAIEGWGQCEVRSISGDPMSGFMSSACFAARESIATAAYATTDTILRMMPLDRTSSPWRTGSVIFRTRDGKIIPFEPGSSLQTTWNYIGFGSPGVGKSVMAATILMAICQQPGVQRLPRIAITDIGPSSEGFIDAIRDMLPPQQQHMVTRFRLRMTPEFSVNPFDTHLGLDAPLPDDKSFLVALLTLLVTPPESGEAYNSMSALVSKVIDEMYRSASRKVNPKRYGRSICEPVDAALDSIGFTTCKDTSWWEVVDALYGAGKVHEAYLAQRYASPVLSDAVSAANSSIIMDLYGGAHVATGESLNKIFSRMIQDAMRDYPILAEVTRFDIGDARIMSIDIDEVAPRGTPAADKQTAVMYMLASFIMTKNWRLSNDESLMKAIPAAYRDYHRKRIADIHEDMKWDVSDEFHRASRVAAAKSVVHDYIVRMREGRKWNRGVILLSQSIDDYPDEMLEFISGVFALEAGTSKNADRLQKTFGFNDSAKRMLMNHANGPAKDGSGSPFLGIFKTKQGVFSQFLVNSISPIEIWSYSTTAEDRLVRSGVFAALGAEKGRRALATYYPAGTAKPEVERLRLRFADASDEERDAGAIQLVVDEIVRRATSSDNNDKGASRTS